MNPLSGKLNAKPIVSSQRRKRSAALRGEVEGRNAKREIGYPGGREKKQELLSGFLAVAWEKI